MPYKDREYAKIKAHELYVNNKERWKNPDGTWKRANQTPERKKEIRHKNYLKHREKLRLKWNTNGYAKNISLKCTYGITLEDYNQMVEDQNGECLICQEKTDKLVVDHNWVTGFVRGLLCSSCNKMIGFSKENINTLFRAAMYLGERGNEHGVITPDSESCLPSHEYSNMVGIDSGEIPKIRYHKRSQRVRDAKLAKGENR